MTLQSNRRLKYSINKYNLHNNKIILYKKTVLSHIGIVVIIMMSLSSYFWTICWHILRQSVSTILWFVLNYPRVSITLFIYISLNILPKYYKYTSKIFYVLILKNRSRSVATGFKDWTYCLLQILFFDASLLLYSDLCFAVWWLVLNFDNKLIIV